MKWLLIFQSLSPLFVLLAVRTCPCCTTNRYALALFYGSLICVFIAIYAYVVFYVRMKSGKRGLYDIEIIDKSPMDKSLEFTLTLIIPLLIETPKSMQDFLVFVFVVTIVVVLLAKSSYWYNNPVLSLLGYKMFLFRFLAKSEIVETVFGISRENIDYIHTIDYTEIYDSKIFYLWSTNNE